MVHMVVVRLRLSAGLDVGDGFRACAESAAAGIRLCVYVIVAKKLQVSPNIMLIWWTSDAER